MNAAIFYSMAFEMEEHESSAARVGVCLYWDIIASEQMHFAAV